MNNNLLKYLVPVVAVIVLVESVMIISNLGKKTDNQVVDNKDQSAEVVPAKETTKAPVMDAVYSISLSSTSSNLMVGKIGKVDVKMMGSSDRSLDSINVYVKYDPAMAEISGLIFDKKLPAPAFSKISTTRGLVVANFLVADASGLKLKTNEILSLMSFNVKPLKAGNINFEISTGSELKESATMIVENATSKVLPFGSNTLTINASL